MKRSFLPPFRWSGKLSWSHLRLTDMGIITQQSGSIVSPQPRTSSQWTDVFMNMPLIFLKLSHTLIAFILSLCIFFSPLPLVPTTPNTKWKEEESEATQDVGHRGREGPEREWTQVSGINWRLEDAKHVVLVIPWLQGHVCSDIWPLWINQKNLMRMSFCAYLKAEWHYVFKYIMLHSTFGAQTDHSFPSQSTVFPLLLILWPSCLLIILCFAGPCLSGLLNALGPAPQLSSLSSSPLSRSHQIPWLDRRFHSS